MINTDRVSLECDLAETYNIFDMKRLPAIKVAFFSYGLRENSRIKMKLSNQKIDTNTLLMAHVIDRLSILIWLQTEDARNGTNKPKSLVSTLLERDTNEVIGFNSTDAFEEARRKIIEKGDINE